MAPEYVVVYQISKQWADWPFALGGVVPLTVGVAMILRKRKTQVAQAAVVAAYLFCVMGILWLCTAGVSVLRADSQALKAFKEGNYQLIEGNVEDFHPMPYEGHQNECFSVQEKRFCYSDYVIAPGFRNTASHGGPIHSGLQVRIAYSGDTILRLEMLKQ